VSDQKIRIVCPLDPKHTNLGYVTRHYHTKTFCYQYLLIQNTFNGVFS
jgi:hypothetical protein